MSFSSRNHDLVAHRSALGARQQAFPLREWARANRRSRLADMTLYMPNVKRAAEPSAITSDDGPPLGRFRE